MAADHDTILTETIARHFEGARVEGCDVDTGVGGLHIQCRVDSTREIGETRSASLFFRLWGGALGDVPIFASTSGYGASVEEAIVVGGCNWACAFGPVFEAALVGKVATEAETFEVEIHGRRYDAVVDGLDRAMLQGDGDDVGEKTRAARNHLGAAPWLFKKVVESGTLPALPLERTVVLSVFCWESETNRTLEVKVHGADWRPSARILDDIPRLRGSGAALLRELVVLVPKTEAPRISSALLGRTLQGAVAEDERASLTDWPGWHAHGGQLGEPASERELSRLEAKLGELPADYREFLLNVQSSGAGPGYGLLSPFTPSQETLAIGEFDWLDGAKPQNAPAGVLALAHAGCGVMWLLVVRGPHRGEVWVDAGGSDELARRVAPSFTVWLHDWLDALVRGDAAFCQWDGTCCATASVVAQLLQSIEAKEGLTGEDAVRELPKRLSAGAIGIASGGGDYFDGGDALDPCEWCANLMSRVGIDHRVFKRGVVPKQARAIKPGFFRRMFGRGPN